MARDFLPYDLDQHYLLPPDMREWLPAGHLVWFVSDVADSLDLSAVMRAYEKRELRGAGQRPVGAPAVTLDGAGGVGPGLGAGVVDHAQVRAAEAAGAK